MKKPIATGNLLTNEMKPDPDVIKLNDVISGAKSTRAREWAAVAAAHTL